MSEAATTPSTSPKVEPADAMGGVDGASAYRADPSGPSGVRLFLAVATVVLVVAALRLASAVFIPLAVAVLLAFLLAPLVDRFERGIGNVPAVVVVAVLAFAVLASVGWGLGRQLTLLGDDLPQYRSNIRDKVVEVRALARSKVLDRFRSTADEVMQEINRTGSGVVPAPQEPVAVVVERQAPSVLLQLPNVLESLATAGLVVVLVIFILVERRGLRDRLLRIAGHAHVAVTTRALDEAAQRISRYLIMQTLINASFGLAIGAGLWSVGVPYALLCGFLAAVLRFIPYIGPIVGGTLPVVLSLAVLPGWQGPLLVLALVLGAELACNMVLEPWLYGQSAGVSQVALLVAIAFWTWLWGPIGLVVATPLTVCLVVLARHVRDMEFVAVLLGDEPPLDLHQRLYQRLLAADAEEACQIAHEFFAMRPESRFYDEMLVPALVRMQGDRAQSRISPADEDRLVASAREVVAALAARADAKGDPDATPAATAAPVRIPAFPADGEADRVGVDMLGNLVASPRARIAPAWWSEAALDGELEPIDEPPPIACIVTLSGSGVGAARRLAQTVRRALPSSRVMVVAWRGLPSSAAPIAAGERGAATSSVVGSLLEARDRIWQATGLELAAPRDGVEGTDAEPSGSSGASSSAA